jgi:hypothetical protein
VRERVDRATEYVQQLLVAAGFPATPLFPAVREAPRPLAEADIVDLVLGSARHPLEGGAMLSTKGTNHFGTLGGLFYQPSNPTRLFAVSNKHVLGEGSSPLVCQPGPKPGCNDTGSCCREIGKVMVAVNTILESDFSVVPSS